MSESGQSKRFGRRELLRVAATTAAGLGVVGAGYFLHDRRSGISQPKLQVVRDHRVALPAASPRMAIVRGKDPAANARKLIEAMGGMAAFVRRGEKVLIKPNAGWNRLPEQGANTDPILVGELVRMALAAGASKVWVSDVPVNNTERCFARSGIAESVGKAGGTLVLPGSNDFRLVEIGGRFLRVGEVIWPLVEADRVINVPIAKHHSLSGTTGPMKNWYGILGGHRVRLHQDISRSIADLAALAKPTLTVLDATRVLMANGPSGGSLGDVKRLDTLAASVDEVALDAFGAELLGRDPSELGFLAEARKLGLGTADYRSLNPVEIGE